MFLTNHHYIKLLRINNYSLSFGSDQMISKRYVSIYSTKSMTQQKQGSHGLRKGLSQNFYICPNEKVFQRAFIKCFGIPYSFLGRGSIWGCFCNLGDNIVHNLHVIDCLSKMDGQEGNDIAWCFIWKNMKESLATSNACLASMVLCYREIGPVGLHK